MDKVFPFGFAGPTVFYLVLYVATLVVHVVFMNYVLAGTGYLVAATLGSRRRLEPNEASMTSVLRDWMPFVLSAAITAGVAPLLFIQILYKKAFYTANLLLFHRWMSILPVLILGFYLLYLTKTQRYGHWSNTWRAIVALGIFACFGFVAYSWTENHLLSTASAETWSRFYASGEVFHRSSEMVPRLALWMTGGVATLAVMVAWQLRFLQQRGKAIVTSPRHVSAIALCGITVSALCGGWYYLALGDTSRGFLTGPAAGLYLAAAVVGLLVQTGAWIVQLGRVEFSKGLLSAASAGVLLSVTGMTVVRETLRLGRIDVARYLPDHEHAIGVGGLWVFLIFALLNAGVVWLCVVLVRRGHRAESPVTGVTEGDFATESTEGTEN